MDETNSISDAPAPAPDAPVAEPVARDPAVVRFESCRWRTAPTDARPFCSHPEVLPMAGMRGFEAASWCVECTFYKAKRAARKPPPRSNDMGW